MNVRAGLWSLCLCLFRAQVDPTGSGRVAAADAALFLKRSGLADLVLGKVSKESNRCRCNASLLSLPGNVDGDKCANCVRLYRSGIWQTLSGRGLSTNRYKCIIMGLCVFRCISMWSLGLLHFCSPQQFFIALRLVACAQNGLEVALKSLNVAVPPPKFVSLLLYILTRTVNAITSAAFNLKLALNILYIRKYWYQEKLYCTAIWFHHHSS